MYLHIYDVAKQEIFVVGTIYMKRKRIFTIFDQKWPKMTKNQLLQLLVLNNYAAKYTTNEAFCPLLHILVCIKVTGVLLLWYIDFESLSYSFGDFGHFFHIKKIYMFSIITGSNCIPDLQRDEITYIQLLQAIYISLTKVV